ncbi:insulinase family protein [Cyanobacterium stanieri LEGE 03274]|uniref:Insulinase family protein n=1 Tax=Cyanobacterium stanieri LEGE 03274 TaxID=1828756 RepID=A0ABR9V3D3_9CHRO|nr:pitrilysin family protein [Cyanobacterium stanieri]MBE9222383.1 insulinase family protein [Cyanobacterium stanieri LEGE 03274]
MVLSTSNKSNFQKLINQSQVNVFHLSNGLSVIHQDMPHSSVVVADVWVDAGVRREPVGWSGIAHFLEHMIFKGSLNVLPGEFDFVVENNGGFANAATSYDYAHFFLVTASQYMSATLPYLGDILLQAQIPDEEFYLERDVVLEELRGSNDDYDWLAFQCLSNLIYPCHPYGRSVLGEEGLLLENTPNQMRCFHKTHYQPERMSVVLVGDIREQDAIALIEDSFGNFGVRSECPPVGFDSEPPMVDIRRQQLCFPRLEQSRLIMGWSGPGIDNLEGAIALDLISMILAGGRTSRLVRQLREEKQLVLDISCDFSLQKDSSLFTISAYLSPQNINKIEEFIRQEIYNLQTKSIDEKELENFKKSLIHDYIFSTETPEQLAGIYGYYHVLKDAKLALQYPQILMNLSAEQIKCYVSQYLCPQYYAVCEVHGS